MRENQINRSVSQTTALNLFGFSLLLLAFNLLIIVWGTFVVRRRFQGFYEEFKIFLSTRGYAGRNSDIDIQLGLQKKYCTEDQG